MDFILPGEPPSKVSKTAEYLATCVGTGAPTLANAGQWASLGAGIYFSGSAW